MVRRPRPPPAPTPRTPDGRGSRPQRAGHRARPGVRDVGAGGGRGRRRPVGRPLPHPRVERAHRPRGRAERRGGRARRRGGPRARRRGDRLGRRPADTGVDRGRRHHARPRRSSRRSPAQSRWRSSGGAAASTTRAGCARPPPCATRCAGPSRSPTSRSRCSGWRAAPTWRCSPVSACRPRCGARRCCSTGSSSAPRRCSPTCWPRARGSGGWPRSSPPSPRWRSCSTRLGLTPLVDLGVRLGDGTGAAAVVPLVQMAARLLGETAVVS